MPDATPVAPATTPAAPAAPTTSQPASTASAPPAATGTVAPAPAAQGSAPDSTVLSGGETGAEPGSKQGGEPEGSSAAPAPIEVKLPDGVSVDPVLFGQFKELAQSYKLTSEQAQKLVDLQIQSAEAFSKQADDAWKQTRTSWTEQAKNDKEYGGQNFDASVKAARQAVAKFGGDQFKQFLNEFGMGDHPELIRFMVRVGKALGEDRVSGSTAAGDKSATPSGEDVLRARYPSMFAQ